jgi:hypothetical protein
MNLPKKYKLQDQDWQQTAEVVVHRMRFAPDL